VKYGKTLKKKLDFGTKRKKKHYVPGSNVKEHRVKQVDGSIVIPQSAKMVK
jgi:hypothetical protein